jgi:NitT/TauT family transport system substrate-binding protein
MARPLIAALIAIAVASAAWAQPREKVLVRFTWKLKGEYAPLYYALEKGYYAAEGLDVEFAEGGGTLTVLQVVGNGTENIGYGPGVAAAQAISRGLPLKVIALYQTQAPIGLISFPDLPLRTPKDLEGRKIAITTGETFSELLEPFLRANRIELGKVERIRMEASARNTQFVSRKVDIMSAFISNELPLMEKTIGVKFNVLKVSDYGLNLPGASFFVNQNYAGAKPETLRKLLRASARGYAEAQRNRKEAAEIMNRRLTIKAQPDVMDAQVKATLDSTNLVPGRPLGWQDEGYWRASLDLLKNADAVKQVRELPAYYTNDFLN